MRMVRTQLNLQLLIRRIMQERHRHVPAQVLLLPLSLSLPPSSSRPSCPSNAAETDVSINVETKFGSGTGRMPTRRTPTPARAPRPSKIAKHGRVAAHLALAARAVARGCELRALVLAVLLLHVLLRLMRLVLVRGVRVLVGGMRLVWMGVARVRLLLVERKGVCGGELEWLVHVISPVACVGVHRRRRALCVLLLLRMVLLGMMSIHLLSIPIRLFIPLVLLLLLLVMLLWMMPLRMRRRRLRQHRVRRRRR
ncbi:hypothetical protein BDW22DRAFT_562804 [Trametopsis cervina]|nr:hypothetical protein BDW22DRAFT_562804 [Trametopsis cervina]